MHRDELYSKIKMVKDCKMSSLGEFVDFKAMWMGLRSMSSVCFVLFLCV